MLPKAVSGNGAVAGQHQSIDHSGQAVVHTGSEVLLDDRQDLRTWYVVDPSVRRAVTAHSAFKAQGFVHFEFPSWRKGKVMLGC